MLAGLRTPEEAEPTDFSTCYMNRGRAVTVLACA